MLYLSAAGLSLVILYLVMHLGQADWSIPVFGPHTADLWFHAMLVKSMIDNGWYLTNPFLGAPQGAALQDFSYAPNLHMAVMKLFSLFSKNYAVVFNLYFLLTYPLSAVAALASFRGFGAAAAPSLVASLLFAFLPYHLHRGQAHLMYASYYLVPLAGMVTLWVWQQQWTRARWLAAALICAVISFDLPYYSFFAVTLLAAGGLAASLNQRRIRPLAPAALLIGVILVSSLLNLAPTFLYTHEHGKNSAALTRDPSFAETYALKIAQLLLPVTGHRFPPFAEFKKMYNRKAPLVNENDYSTLGLVSSAGFCLLLALLLAPALPWSRDPLLAGLARLNLAAVLVATVGGFGSLAAFTILPQIRGYNRMSIYIAYFCLFAVALALSRLPGLPAALLWPLCGALLALGIWDQTTPCFVPCYEKVRREMASDRDFVERIEASLPPGAMVFQLPHVSFPESGFIAGMPDYSHVKSGYLHSRRLRWSYGAIKGRPEDAWQAVISQQPPAALAEALVLQGFSGVSLDRLGYPDRGRALEADFAALLGARPLESRNQRLVFFPLAPLAARLKSGLSDAEWRRKQEESRSAPIFSWPAGCYPEEELEQRRWRWCGHEGQLLIANPSQQTMQIDIDMRLVSAHDPVQDLAIQSPLVSALLTITPAGTPFHAALTVPPGSHVIRLLASGHRAEVPGDGRTMVFSVENFRFHVQ